ncbi:uncharacterized protein DFL_009026 [Arthrobotrys flagrans]|uniref:Peptidase S8/S53 domain-containing protein n=1 Tax=Arthrobotrys flagrans TaxID=97331 RepID=A0A436ZQH4_ARTFL|nr:hypothetical protein DFL_009026 [Arthrobotrys flagrans]
MMRRSGEEGEEQVIARLSYKRLPELSAPKDYYQQWRDDEQLGQTYFHYEEPGQGVVVYALDSGCGLGHQEPQYVAFQDYIVTGDFPVEPYIGGLDDRVHGT